MQMDAETIRKAQAYERIMAEQQIAAFGDLKDTDLVRIKAIRELWLSDGKILRGEVIELPAKDARNYINLRQADHAPNEPISQVALDRLALERAQREAAMERWELQKKRAAAIQNAIEGL